MLLPVALGAGCFLLSVATGTAAWPTWLVTTSTATAALGHVWPARWFVLAALLVVTQPIWLYLANVLSGEIERPTSSTGGLAGVCISALFMLACAALPLCTGLLGARLGRWKASTAA